MGFGRGILAQARRGPLLAPVDSSFGFFAPAPRFPPVVGVSVRGVNSYLDDFRAGVINKTKTSGKPQARALVVTPVGTPSLRFGDIAARREDGIEAAISVPVEGTPEGAVTYETSTSGPPTLERTLVSDARDLFVTTVFARTAVRIGEELNADASQPVLATRNESPTFWADEAGESARQYIHIGPTLKAQEILHRSAGTFLGNWEWDGLLPHLDGDGFVALSIYYEGAFHLLLTGGDGYGTYHGVCWFLENYLGVGWCLPNPRLGTIIPREPEFVVTREVNWIDEPDYRSRTMSVLSGGVLNSIAEVNDYRNWALRMRVRPFTDRAVLFVQANPDVQARFLCPTPEQVLPFHQKVLYSSEERIPGAHNLSSFWSPYLPSLDPDLPAASRSIPRVDAVRDMFPDPRVRITASPSGILAGQRPLCTRSVPVPALTQGACVGTVDLEQPYEGGSAEMLLAPKNLPHADDPDGACPSTPNLSDDGIRLRFARDLMTQDGRGSSTESPGRRFIPRAFRQTILGPSKTVDGWAPCLYVYDRATIQLGRMPAFRDTVARDLAVNLVLRMANLHTLGMLHGEFCEALAPDDGTLWCECTACRFSNGLDLANDAFVMYNGAPVADYTTFLPSQIGGTDRVYDPTYPNSTEKAQLQRQIDFMLARLDANLQRALGITLLRAVWGGDSLSPDVCARQGIFVDPGRLNVRTRRSIDLVNATARLLARPRPEFGLEEENFKFTFHAYLDFSGAPLFSADPVLFPRRFYSAEGVPPDPAEADAVVLHPSAIPLITGTREAKEYDDDDRAPGLRSMLRLYLTPDQFGLERWSYIARQIGIYEYMQGSGFVVPRIYSKRLANGLRRAHERYRARVFVAETAPNHGLDGIKYYETAKVLWDLHADVATIRQGYCDKMFGAGTTASAEMRAYFDTLEEIWAARPDYEQRSRVDRMGTPRGHGIMGRYYQITQLNLYMEEYRDETGRLRSRESAASLRAWGHLQQAFRNSAGLVQERVQFFRRTYGLTRELIRVYLPIWEAWQPLEQYMDRFGRDVNTLRNALDQPTVERLANAALFPVRPAWATMQGFRDTVRTPIHRYLGNHDLEDSLGLGLARYSESGDEFDFTRGLLDAHHRMEYGLLYSYLSWWNVDGRLSTRTTLSTPVRSDGTRREVRSADEEFGNLTFGLMKELILQMMQWGGVIATPPRDMDAIRLESEYWQFRRDA